MQVNVKHPRCPYCHTGVVPADPKTPCQRCMSWHHTECWEEHGRCASCSAPAAPAARPASAPKGCNCGEPGFCREHFQLDCPTQDCAARFQVPNRLSGTQIECQRCGVRFGVPTWKSDLYMVCTGGCGSSFRVSNGFADHTIRCGNCGHTMRVPE